MINNDSISLRSLSSFPYDDDDGIPLSHFKVIRHSMCLFTTSKMKKVIEICSAGDPMTTTNVAALVFDQC